MQSRRPDEEGKRAQKRESLACLLNSERKDGRLFAEECVYRVDCHFHILDNCNFFVFAMFYVCAYKFLKNNLYCLLNPVQKYCNHWPSTTLWIKVFTKSNNSIHVSPGAINFFTLIVAFRPSQCSGHLSYKITLFKYLNEKDYGFLCLQMILADRSLPLQ